MASLTSYTITTSYGVSDIIIISKYALFANTQHSDFD